MKRSFVSFVLIFALIFSVFAGNNKKAHRELRKAFNEYSLLPELKAKGFDLNKLDELNTWKEIKNYLQPFLIDEEGFPLDCHLYIGTTNGSKLKTQSQMYIEWSDEYGSKDELLEKGYVENENMFYYPLYNGEWHDDGYRVGKKYMDKEHYPHITRLNYSENSEKSLLVGLADFIIENNKDNNKQYYDEISNSKKDYLILDFSYNCGGKDISWHSLEKAIKEMQPKEIFILCGCMTKSMAADATLIMEAATNIKTTVVGYPTWAGWNCGRNNIIIEFETFEMECNISDDDHNPNSMLAREWTKAHYNVILPKEGIGAMPDIFTDGNVINSLEVVKQIINDDEISLPSYVYNIYKESNNIRL